MNLVDCRARVESATPFPQELAETNIDGEQLRVKVNLR